MIDFFFKFTNEAAAIVDASGSQYYHPSTIGSSGQVIPGGWKLECVCPGIQVWRASQDITGTSSSGNPTVTHTFLTGWYGTISIMENKPALMNHPALQIAIDREKSAAGQPAILKNNLGAVVLQDLRFQPVFAGSNYPFGNLI